MLRFLAGAAACFLFMTGAFLIWQSRAEHRQAFPNAAAAGSYGTSLLGAQEPLRAPEADEKTRAQKRFSRYDKNKDGKVEIDEYLAARRKNFDKLDVNHDGRLSFEEYAAKAIDKFNTAGGRKGWLSETEFATTAPVRTSKRKASCSCRTPASSQPQAADNNSDDGQ